jgi:triacylglycerol lipase
MGLGSFSLFADVDNGGPDLGVRCYVAQRGQHVVLAFKGTSDLPGWLTDANVPQVPAPGGGAGKVHSGFAKGLARVWDRVLPRLPKKGSGLSLWVTGHSLGGGLATLAANALCNDPNYEVAGTYTYGSPRVGNLAYYADYKAINFRCVNNDDVVPQVPLEMTLVGFHLFVYKHVGTLEYFDRHGQLGGGTSNWEIKKDMMLGNLEEFEHPSLQWPGPIRDHFMASYLTSIERNLPPGTPTLPIGPPSAAEQAEHFAAAAALPS